MPSASPALNVRPAGPADTAAVVATLTGAFHDDPTWSWAFSDPTLRPHQYDAFWGAMVAGALRYPWVLMTGGAEAVAVWIPPGGTELAPEDEPRLVALIENLLGDRAADVLELMDRFDAAHPHDEPHYYLSLFATRPESRGRGIGMALLRDDLVAYDAEGVPTYLESSNPANDARYASVGYRAVGEFSHPTTGAVVTTMWRPVGG